MIKRIGIKNILGIIFGIMLIVSGLFLCIKIGEREIFTFKIKGYIFVLTGMFFYIHSLYIKGSLEHNISGGVILFGYFYSFCLFFINRGVEDFFLGFYLYILSFILFIISFFMRFVKDNILIDGDNELEKEDFILGEYCSGVVSKDKVEKGVCALSFSKEFEGVSLILPIGDKISSYNIERDNIISIKVSIKILNEEERNVFLDNTIPNMVLVTALFGDYGAILGKGKTYKNITNYNKIKNNVIYEVKIRYLDNGEKRNIIMRMVKSPKAFFKNYSDIYKEDEYKKV